MSISWGCNFVTVSNEWISYPNTNTQAQKTKQTEIPQVNGRANKKNILNSGL